HRPADLAGGRDRGANDPLGRGNRGVGTTRRLRPAGGAGGEAMKAETQESVRRAASAIVTVLGIAASVYHLYAAYWYPLFALQHRALHLLFMGTILFLVHTVLKEKRLTWPKLVYTLVFVGLTIAATSYVLINYDSVATRAGAYNRWDIAFGIMMLLVVFEGARRGTGWPIVIVAAAFFVFAF